MRATVDSSALLATAFVGLSCLTSLSAQAPGGAPQARGPYGEQGDLDALIDRLPPADYSRVWNAESKEWRKDPAAETLRRELGRSLCPSDDQWRRLLLEKGVIRFREKWPQDVPLAIGIRVPVWLRETQIKLTPASPNLSEAVADSGSSGCGTCDAFGREREDYQELGTLPSGTHELEFRVTVRASRAGLGFYGPENAGLLWRGDVTLGVEVVSGIEDVVPPVSDAGIDLALRRAIGVGFYQSARHVRPMPYIVVDEDDDSRASLFGVALVMEGALMKDGEIVETVPLDAGVYDEDALEWNSVDVVGMRLAHYPLEKLPAGNRDAALDLEGWNVRVWGSREGVLGEWAADRWWNGSVVIPLDEAIANEDARFRRMPRAPWQWPD